MGKLHKRSVQEALIATVVGNGQLIQQEQQAQVQVQGIQLT